MVAPALFRSSDTGAPSLSGTSGDLISVLDFVLVIGKVFSTANDTSFTDNTTEARLNGGTTFTLFPTPATGDRTYYGSSIKFTQLVFAFGTVGTTATYVWEYWNGSAWSTLTVSDGTTNFTTNGTVSWTAPANWATTSVNSTTLYWVRVRFTGSAPATNPLVNSVSYLGWLVYFSGTNLRMYRQDTSSNQYYLKVRDDAPGAGGAKEARIRGYEVATGVSTTDASDGSNLFPTTAQATNGWFVRKSVSADAVTRSWTILADGRTMYMFVQTGDTAGVYYIWMFGEYFSFKSADAARTIIVGRDTENSAAATAESFDRMTFGIGSSLAVTGGAGSSANPAKTINRSYTQAVGAISNSAVTFLPDGSLTSTPGSAGNNTALDGTLSYKNPSDNLIYVSSIRILENTAGTAGTLRGRLRGIWQFCHTASNGSDGDTFSGSNDLSSKTFLFLKNTVGVHAIVLETSATWDSN